MDIFSIDLTVAEIQAIRQALDVITLSGKDAKFVALLQVKLESELQAIQVQLQEMEMEKQQELQKAIELDKKIKSKG